jgi:hypothetical protein
VSSKTLVLVVGAGASSEVNLPTGAQLKTEVAKALDIRFERMNELISGDRAIVQAFEKMTMTPDGRRGDINPLQKIAWRIRDAMPQAISIDNFIDAHRSDPQIAACGKLAIARSILSAETASPLTIDPGNVYNTMNFEALANTWLNVFFQLLTENCESKDLKDRLQNLTVITFNYDRCIEQYLYWGLQNYYGMSGEAAADALSCLEIHHPYGVVAALPWQRLSGSIEFGARPTITQLIDASAQLRTFTEGTDPARSDICATRAAIRSAERVAFLGFAYHRLNLELLFGGGGELTSHRAAYGTVFGVSAANTAAIRRELTSMGGFARKDIALDHLKCGDFLCEYSRSLSLE